ncbi:SRPBCC domain-containing protein [Actinophytocola sp.]|uniref:SRPBCC family protein n=1 Tax=Actinophytocola sp. TaxID=1872138 RepID=UPI003899E4AB
MTDLDLTITRVFDAPRELVFEVWTNPDQLAKWFGPTGFTAEACTVKLAEGGQWRACIRNSAEGVERWVGGVYHEIDRPARLAFSFAWEEPKGTPGHDTLVTITFDDRDGKTEMTFHQAIFESVEDRDGHQDGWRSTFDDLNACLATLTNRGDNT